MTYDKYFLLESSLKNGVGQVVNQLQYYLLVTWLHLYLFIEFNL